MTTPLYSARGGPRNLTTPLRRPCDKALDAQASTDELQSLLAQARGHGLSAHADWLSGVVMGSQAILRVFQRELQIALEADLARLEGR